MTKAEIVEPVQKEYTTNWKQGDLLIGFNDVVVMFDKNIDDTHFAGTVQKPYDKLSYKMGSYRTDWLKPAFIALKKDLLLRYVEEE